MESSDIDGLYLAGGFGSYVDTESAMKIGMLPRIEKDKLHSIGNTALAGAAMMALDPEKRGVVRRLTHDCGYIELSGRSDFAAAFTENMSF